MKSVEIVEQYDLGAGLVARAEYWDRGANEAPKSGSSWAREDDLPTVGVRFALPQTNEDGFSRLRQELRSDVKVCGETLDLVWGQPRQGERVMEWRVTRERVTDAVNEARASVRGAVEILRGVVSARLARLAARDETLRLAREGSPFTYEEVTAEQTSEETAQQTT